MNSDLSVEKDSVMWMIPRRMIPKSEKKKTENAATEITARTMSNSCQILYINIQSNLTLVLTFKKTYPWVMMIKFSVKPITVISHFSFIADTILDVWMIQLLLSMASSPEKTL